MKNIKIRVLTPLVLALFTFGHPVKLTAQNEPYPSKKLKTEKNLSHEILYESQFIVVNNDSIHYYEKGEGEVFLFLHGIPTSSYLWRNVIKQMPDNKRSIAFDFIGYGKSSMPQNDDFSFLRQVNLIGGFLDSLKIPKVNLVVNDIGSMFGLYYAMKNESRISSITLVEAVILPAEDWYRNVPWIQKKMFATVQKSEKSKQKWIIDKDILLNTSMKMLTKRRLSKEEMKNNTEPFENKQRRRVMLEGTGPTSFTNKGMSQTPDDEMALQNWYAERLKQTKIPILLLYAYPGWLINKEAVEYAQANFKNYTDAYIGKGKHFVQEDQPTRIAQEINIWFASLEANESKANYDLSRIEHVSNTQLKIHTEITIDKPIEEVWNVMTDFDNTGNWSSYFQGIEGDFIDGGSIYALYKTKPKANKTKQYKKEDILIDSTNYTFGWASQPVTVGVKDNHHYKLIALSENQTKLIHTDEVKGFNVALLGDMISKLFFEMHTTYNKELKRECEKIRD
jgi:haloalkane dehalogenase